MENKETGALIEVKLPKYGEVKIDFENLTVGDYEKLEMAETSNTMPFDTLINLLSDCISHKRTGKKVFNEKSVKAMKIKELRKIVEIIFGSMPKQIEDIKKN